MRIKQYLAATVAAASIGAFGFAAAPAHADNIVLNQWYTGHFTATPSPLFGGAGTLGTDGPVLPGGFANAVAAPTAPWTITLSRSGTLTVSDMETSGDQFTLFDNGVAMAAAASPFTAPGQNPGQASPGGGNTSAPCAACVFGNVDINAALGDADYSSGTFHLGPGVNVITGTFNGVIGFGDFNFIAETVPEPATWAVMLVGFLGLGASLRMSRRKNGAVTA